MMSRTTRLRSAAMLVALCVSAPAGAQQYYLGEILPVGFTYCPQGTVEASGQILPIASFAALYSLYGTTYGGNGQTTFALPDLRGRSPIHVGDGPGLSPVAQGQSGGAETATLTVNQLPSHSHSGHMRASNTPATIDNPANATIADFPDGLPRYSTQAPDTNMADNTVQTDNTGGSQPFGIRSPYLTIRFCVVMQGVFPSRP